MKLPWLFLLSFFLPVNVMTKKPKVVAHANILYSIVTKYRIRRFLCKAREKDLVGLDLVVATWATGKKKKKGVLGEYVDENKMIVLYLNQIYAGKSYTMLFPVAGGLMLADTFFHEVGHHFLANSHSIKKNMQEFYANQYAGKMMNKTFPVLFYILRRIVPASKR